MQSQNAGRRVLLLQGVAAVAPWMLLFAVQALHAPLDGYVPHQREAAVRTPLCGPILAELLIGLLGTRPAPRTLQTLYGILLVAVPLASVANAAWIGRSSADWARSPLARNALLALVLALATASVFDLTWLSNDVHLYLAHGRLVSELGLNPYVTTAAQVLPAAELQGVPWTSQLCPYGPLAVAAFALVTELGRGPATELLLLKLLLASPLFILLAWSAYTRKLSGRARIGWLAWIGLDPLLVLEVGQSSHLDGWIGMALACLVLTLDRPSVRRVLAAGVLGGLASGLKPSVLVLLPVVAAWILASSERGGARRTAAWLCLPLAVAWSGVLVALYLPFWEGAQTFEGMRQEAGKVVRSLYSLLAADLGMPRSWIVPASLVGNVAAALAGAGVCLHRRNLTEGVLTCLLVQAISGRAFLQSWYFCPVVMLAPCLAVARNGWTSAPAVEPARSAAWARAVKLLSASAVAGGYGVFVLAGSRSSTWQTVSLLCMLAPPWLVRAGGLMSTSARSARSCGPD